ncbi:unnamed protein product [Acanthoscelides obtectus]|uniref:Uncharacterized protein n=1 Tax=Acanthoscelides obtectus TaxID=200917 RepID=A0A9P0Q4A5_ACAOB|nr:unnamed protein product [Acanthoscelides obtectus]CAK1668692.1 hypothetical protein AOBTE_LOCUS26539 [Acanthoscelides obtectus]
MLYSTPSAREFQQYALSLSTITLKLKLRYSGTSRSLHINQQKATNEQKYSSETPKKTNDAIQIQLERQDLNKSFNELLPTPELFRLKENKAPKRKSINYKAQLVTKDLFSSRSSKCELKRKIRKQPTASSSKILVENCSDNNTPKSESWYC